MKKTILAISSMLILAGCGGGGSGGSGGKYQAVAPLRYLAENYKKIDDTKIAKYLKALSKDDADFLGSTYTSFASYLQHQGCNADKSLVVLQEPSALYTKPVEVTCDQNDVFIENTIQLLKNIGGYQEGDEFQKAHSDAGELILVIKCDTGEIDKGSCALYWKGVANMNNAQKSFYKDMLDQNSEFTRELTNQCTYDGQALDNGAVCVAN